MVYVEGAAKFIRQYKRLMLHRIAWTEAARERGAEDVEIDRGEDEEGNETTAAGPSNTATTGGEDGPVSLEDNQCWLIWEGERLEPDQSVEEVGLEEGDVIEVHPR